MITKSECPFFFIVTRPGGCVKRECSLYYEVVPKVTAQYLAARREHILSAAAVRFARDGFHRTSIQDVIDEAGLSPGAVYRYFRSKDQIILAISADAMATVEAAVRDALRTDRSVADLIAALPRALADLDQADERMRLAVQAWGEALRDPAVAAAMRSGLRGVRDALRARIVHGQGTGEVAAQVEPDAASRVLLSLVQGFILQRAWEPDLDVDAYGRGARDVVAGLLITPGGSST